MPTRQTASRLTAKLSALSVKITQRLLGCWRGFKRFLRGICVAQRVAEEYDMINSETTVRDVALQMPQSTRLFERLKIDYCCGGNRPLAEACASAGVDLDNVMEMLTEVTPPDEAVLDFQNMSLPELITHILETHHVFTKSEMDRLQALADKVLAAHGGNHPELVHLDELITRLCADLKPHMFKEEQILFPYMLAMAQATAEHQAAPFAPFGTVNNPIRMMM